MLSQSIVNWHSVNSRPWTFCVTRSITVTQIGLSTTNDQLPACCRECR